MSEPQKQTADEQRLLAKGWQRVPVQTLSGTKMMYAAPDGGGTFELVGALALVALQEDDDG